MKKNISAGLLLALSLGFCSVQAQTTPASVQAQVVQTDSVVKWMSYSKKVLAYRQQLNKNYVYNAAGKLLSFESWAAEAPEETKTKTVYTYNTAGKVATETTQKKNTANQYFNYITISYTYNGTGQLTQTLTTRYNSSAGQLLNYGLIKTAYNSTGSVLSDSSFYWANNVWTLSDAKTYTYTNNKIASREEYSDMLYVRFKYSYLYNASDSVTRVLQQSTPTSATNWTNKQKDTIIYANGKRSQLIRYTINANTGAWQQSQKTTYEKVGAVLTETVYYYSGASWVSDYKYERTYDASNRIVLYVSQQYSGSQWKNLNKRSFAYNTAGLQTQDYNYSWSSTANAWYRWSFWNYTYGLNNTNTVAVHKIFSTTADTLTQLDSTINYIRLATVGTKSLAQNNKLNIYPNPSTGVFILTSEPKMASIAVYSVLGEKVYETSTAMLQANTFIDLSNQAKGNYLIMLTDKVSGQVYTQRIVKE